MRVAHRAEQMCVGVLQCVACEPPCRTALGPCDICGQEMRCGDTIWVGYDDQDEQIDAHDSCVTD